MKPRKCINVKLSLILLADLLTLIRGEDCVGCVLREKILDCSSVTRPGDSPWPSCSSSNMTVAASFKDSDIKNLGRFPTLKTLERISLSHNDMESIEDGAFEGLPSLTHLDLSHNLLEVEDISPTVLRGAYSPERYEPMALESLNLGWNLLHSLDAKAFEHCVSLRELRLDGNPLRIVDSNTVLALGSQPLQMLSLSGTRLAHLPHTFFENLGGLRSLRVLSLSSNNLTTVPRGLALLDDTLEELILSRNPVEVVDDGSLEGTWPRLRVVDLSDMPELRRVGPRAFSALRELRDLQCHGNPRLAEVHQHALQGLHHLRRVRLDGNDLRQLDLEVPWSQLEVLTLSRNPWQCDCVSLQWLHAAAPYITDDPRMRTYTRKSTRGSVSQELMQKAADAVIKDGRKIKTVAKELDICHMSLYRFVKKLRTGVENIAIGYKKVRLVFTEEQENKLAEYLLKCASIFFGLLPDEVKKLAYECALKFNPRNIPPSWHKNRKAGPDWLTGFLKKHPHLSIRAPESTSASRATSFNRHNVSEFFTKLSTVMDKYKFPPSRIYNLDETGVTTVLKPRKIIAKKGTSGIANLPASSGVIEIQLGDQGPFCPEAVRPFPKAPPRIGSNKRRRRKSAVLTDTPEKQALAEEQSKKRKVSINNEEVRKNKGKGKGKTKQGSGKGKGKGKGKSIKRQVLQMSSKYSENEEDSLEYYCLVCCDSYSNSRSGEEWVQCQECKNWAHSRCRQNQDLLTYLCPKCDSDISSDD